MLEKMLNPEKINRHYISKIFSIKDKSIISFAEIIQKHKTQFYIL